MIVKPKIFQSTGTYKVRFFYWDVLGGVLTQKILERYVNSGGTVIPPAVPQTLTATTKRSPTLEFVSWNYSNANLTNITQDIDVGAVYRNATTDGIRKTHAFIITTANTGLAVPVYFNKSDTSELTISWGDGSANYTTSSSGNVNTTHTYSVEGAYEITMWINSGSGTYSFSNGSATTDFIGGSNIKYKKCLVSLFVGDNVTTISAYGLYSMSSLRIVNIPSNVTSIGTYAFAFLSVLEYLVIPSQCLTLGAYSFRSCSCLKNIFLGDGVTSIGDACFYAASSLSDIIISNSVTSLGTEVFNTSGAVNVKLSDNISSIPANTFENCSRLQSVIFSNTITSIAANGFAFCGNLFSITIPSDVTSIENLAFKSAFSLTVLTIKRFTAPEDITTLGTENFYAPNYVFRIYVPVGSLSVYQAATNWSTYANRMYEDTAENRALFGD
jgi:hypothetical protein